MATRSILDQIMKLQNTPLSGAQLEAQIMKLTGNKLPIALTTDENLPSSSFILFEGNPNRVGHWTLVIKRKNSIEYFDSTGLNRYLNFLQERYPKKKFIVNEYPLQSGFNEQTCGRWVIVRYNNLTVPLEKFVNVFKALDSFRGFDGDKVASVGSLSSETGGEQASGGCATITGGVVLQFKDVSEIPEGLINEWISGNIDGFDITDRAGLIRNYLRDLNVPVNQRSTVRRRILRALVLNIPIREALRNFGSPPRDNTKYSLTEAQMNALNEYFDEFRSLGAAEFNQEEILNQYVTANGRKVRRFPRILNGLFTDMSRFSNGIKSGVLNCLKRIAIAKFNQ